MNLSILFVLNNDIKLVYFCYGHEGLLKLCILEESAIKCNVFSYLGHS